MNKTSVAFLGLGLMGSGMARRLIGAGFAVTVYNRNAEKAAPLAAAGARVAATPRAAAAGAGIIISMVADDGASRSLWLGENGALAGAQPGTVCIECSTVTVGWIHELAGAVKAAGGALLDAPVTGSKNNAAAGELNFLVGGDPFVLEQARPVLAVMSKSIAHLGPTGSGAMIKLINNFVCGVQVAALAEALTMIERSGLERARALEVLTNGAPGSPLVKIVSARMSASDFTPNFHLHLLAKDLVYAIHEGAKLGVELVTGAAALRDFQNGLAAGLAHQDMSAVIEPLRQKK